VLDDLGAGLRIVLREPRSPLDVVRRQACRVPSCCCPFSYAGARPQSRLPETSLRRLLGLIACLLAARYTQTAIQQFSARTPAHVASS
jgi:hypothetical protein